MTIMAAGMIRILHIKRMLVASFLLIISSWLQAGVEMNRFKNYTFWDFIEIIDQAMPLDKENAEVLFDDQFIFSKQRGRYNEWRSQDLETKDGIVLDDITFVLNQDDSLSNGGFFHFNTKNQCLTLKNTKQKVEGVVLHSGPKGRSLHDTSVWRASRSWGDIFFSFEVRDPDCLAYVTFKRPK